MLKVENLVKKYGNDFALRDVSFEVKKGHIVGLLGPNGAGKSTTMNIITGYISATSGKVTIGEYDILKDPIKAKSQIGYLPEIPPLYKDMTVYEYLIFVADLKFKKANKKELAQEAMVKTDILSVKNQIIKKLSKGFQQRVGLAGALLGNPPILILDEPLVGLDPSQTREMRQMIKALAGEQTIIISSHILSEINEMCDSIVIMNRGKVQIQDSTKNLTKKEKNNRVITMMIKGNKVNIDKVISKSKLISEIKITDSEESGVYNVIANVSGTRDIRDEMFSFLAKNGLTIYNLTYEKVSLEEVFIRLTQENKCEDNISQEVVNIVEEELHNEEEINNVVKEDSTIINEDTMETNVEIDSEKISTDDSDANKEESLNNVEKSSKKNKKKFRGEKK